MSDRHLPDDLARATHYWAIILYKGPYIENHLVKDRGSKQHLSFVGGPRHEKIIYVTEKKEHEMIMLSY